VIENRALRDLVVSVRVGVRNLGFAARHCRNALEVARAVLAGGHDTTVELHDGTTMSAPDVRTLLPLLDEVFIDRAYDHGRVVVRPGDVVVDIGAHVGAFVVRAARAGAARIVACEPSPMNVRHLRRNIERNGVGRVTVVEAAVGAREGRATLGIGRFSVGNLLLDEVTNEPVERTVEVRSTTLAGIFAGHALAHVDVLKIDCEGSEGALLAAAPRELLERIDRIALEYHDNWSSLDHDALAQLLRTSGFTVAVHPHERQPFGMIYAWREV
jgi:FkbM family methyltransferase